ncbi:type I polyketide synthase [Nisaea denitrificans]|uniref:type I polyketide synthase n=1 Tax=Nisaea denitrificans TaxID=390877 RepID=UPI00041B538D|nr:type I polyketide synthase [Nisaea denitrificans]
MTAENTVPERDLIAIVGMAGRFPQADGVEALWQLLREGREGLTRFDPDTLRAAGVHEELSAQPGYVPVNGALPDIEMFDSAFFQMPPSEARITDPQHRVMLELAWNALENSGHDPERYDGSIGVYVGCGPSSYLLNNLYPNRAALAGSGELPIQIGNNKDYLATRISYKLNLTGPSVCITTACSTSLVAVHFAAQSLLGFECDMALAGGASIQVPQQTGYLHQEGGILSPDGHCRAFDADAKGTVGGNGAAIVVLKRLADAVADGDRIHAIIRGSAVNNDGAHKAGYTAPSVDGQARVIAEAQEVGEVDPASVGYIEAHGTGTPLGDPIEIAALNQVFGASDMERHLGSVKTNLGHLDEAAGITGLIKTTMALQHREIPPSLHFQRPNPEIDLPASGFTVNDTVRPWSASADGTPRRAGVSSFGIGGTNAHVVLEEAPARETCPDARPLQLLPVSARSEQALAERIQGLASWLETHPEEPLGDTAFTLQRGRRAFSHRATVIAGDSAEAREALRRTDATASSVTSENAPPIVFLCSGQGSQYPGMTRALYQDEPVFRAALDECADGLNPHLGLDLRGLLYPEPGVDEEEAVDRLRQTAIAQPALFSVEYAMAALWRHWGVEPTALIGHSLGEYVAACLSGVMDLDTALALVAARGRLMQSAPSGAMLAVALSPRELDEFLGDGLEIAAINAPNRCVVSGTSDAIDTLSERLEETGHQAQRLSVSHAFHSALMEPILEDFAREIGRHTLNAPSIPYVSNVTGTWITAEEARDPAAYQRHLRAPVAFSAGIECVLKDYPDAVFLEIGPGRALASMASRIAGPKTRALSSLPSAGSGTEDHRVLLASLGALWCAGTDVNWDNISEPERGRVPLPGYPFERARHWVDAGATAEIAAPEPETGKRADVATWFYTPTWKRLPWGDGGHAVTEDKSPWLLLGDGDGLGLALAERLRARGEHVVTVRRGPGFFSLTADSFLVRPTAHQDFTAMLDALSRDGKTPARIVHLWSLVPDDPDQDGFVFQSLIATAKALSEHDTGQQAEITLVCRGVEDVYGEEELSPHAAAAMGPAMVIPQEFPSLSCRSVDIVDPGEDKDARRTCIDALIRLLTNPSAEKRIALRGRYKWGQVFEPASPTAPEESLPIRLRNQGVYLITGGLGRIGLLLAAYLAERADARLVLIGRSTPTDTQSGHIAAIERSGGRVLAFPADVGNPEEMRCAKARAEAAFGRIDGVIHAAALPASESYREIAALTAAERAREFHAKVDGLAVLEEIFEETPPDFFMLFSSLSAVLGGLGFAAYAAANSILDATARDRQRAGNADWISVNWDGWDFETTRTSGSALESRLREASITAEEGTRAFDLLFNSASTGQIAVSTSDLLARLARQQVQHRPEASEKAASSSDNESAECGTETIMTSIWCAVLGLEKIGPNDDFFALNGDSLLGTQLMAQINRRFGSRLQIKTLFESPTVAGLSALIEQDQGAEDSTEETESITPAETAADYPLTHGQKRLWILSQSREASVAYNMAYNMRLGGPLDTEALRGAFAYIIDRHESLRSAFATREGEPRQSVRAGLPFMLPVRDLSGTRDPVEAARDAAKAEARRLFDLTQPPLLRAELLRLSDEDHVLLVSLHHIVCDGLSLNVLMRELHEAYSALRDDTKPAHPPLTLQYRDFAAWQNRQIESEAMTQHQAYWLDKLQGEIPALNLGDRSPASRSTSFDGGQVFVTLARTDQQLLEDLCREQQVTLFMVLTAAFKVLLHQASGQEDIVIGTPVAGREVAELDGQIGLYLNNLVLRDRVTRRESFKDLLRQVRTTVAEAFAHQSYPYDRLVEDLSSPGTERRTPLFDAMLNLMPSQDLNLQLGDLKLESFMAENETTLFDLNVMVNDAPSGLAMEFAFNTERHDAAAIQALADGYLILLRSLAADPEQSVRALCARLGRRTGEAASEAATEKAAFLSGALNLDEVF